MSTSTDITPTALVDALQGTFGRHPGARASHAKGFCATGQFLPAADVMAFVGTPLFARAKVPATLRFSVGGGNPKASDTARSARGLAMRLEADDQCYDLVLVSEPVFFAATPESFVQFLCARVPDPVTGKPNPERVAAYQAAFPDGARQPAMLASHAAPASHATTPYFSNNAFLFTGSGGASNAARLVLEPDAGTHYLDAEQEASLPDDFLRSELQQRLAGGPVGFTLYAQLPAAGDSLTDPSVEWKGAARVRLGVLNVLALADDGCDPVSFVPTNLPRGIDLTDDPILRARKASYLVSVHRRTLTGPL